MIQYKDRIDRKRIPAHIAIIMDGNGRWAKKKSLPRIEGHRRGAGVIEPLMDSALGLGIRTISLYAFSTENWSRPKTEISGLWRLLEHFFETKIQSIHSKGVRIRHSGSLERLPESTQTIVRNAVEQTAANKKITLNFCLNYGGRQEISDAVNRWLAASAGRTAITPEDINNHLYTAGLPDVDLLIRTSGECRISNFMLWQIAYAEMIFMKVLWPDFRPQHLFRAIYDFQNRERRFGGL